MGDRFQQAGRPRRRGPARAVNRTGQEDASTGSRERSHACIVSFRHRHPATGHAPGTQQSPPRPPPVTETRRTLMTTTRPSGRQFSDDFLWGSATASYQIEGAHDEGGRGPSIWDTFSRTPGKVLNGDTGDVAVDHYHRVPEDVEIMKSLGLQAYRFSIAWPRIQPTGSGEFNQAGLDFYSDLVDRLIAAGIKPVATLYHWDLPQPLEDEGGWANRATAYRFVEYARKLAEVLGKRVDLWTTLNEPWCSAFLGYASGVHAPASPTRSRPCAPSTTSTSRTASRAARSARSSARTRPSRSREPARDARRRRLRRLRRGQAPHRHHRERGLPRPAARRRVPQGGLRGHRAPHRLVLRRAGRPRAHPHPAHRARRQLLLDRPREEGQRAGADPGKPGPDGHRASEHSSWVGADEVEWLPQPGPHTAMGWNIEPDGLVDLLLELRDRYPSQPLAITENGAAFYDTVSEDGRVHDPERVGYLHDHVDAVGEAIDKGADVRAYFVWSLLDNFEWRYGYDRRFGIVRVDYDTHERIVKDSGLWYRELVRTRTIAPAEDAATYQP
uniref:Beta-glucosidase n=1 Tax=Cellulomonas fimi TaxID=1708 RepID=Q46043_CELFI|nr:beta-glucosidase [Cellulomonas fimi]